MAVESINILLLTERYVRWQLELVNHVQQVRVWRCITKKPGDKILFLENIYQMSQRVSKKKIKQTGDRADRKNKSIMSVEQRTPQ